MEETKKKKQYAENKWSLGEDSYCKMTIETTGDENNSSDIYAQWKGLMEALGFSMGGF